MKPFLPATWAEFVWPDWVPLDERAHIASFWSEDYGRSPAQWYAGTVADPYNKHPEMGTRVRAEGFSRRDPEVTGRWLPCWNNIGRVVRDDGVAVLSSSGCILEILT